MYCICIVRIIYIDDNGGDVKVQKTVLNLRDWNDSVSTMSRTGQWRTFLFSKLSLDGIIQFKLRTHLNLPLMYFPEKNGKLEDFTMRLNFSKMSSPKNFVLCFERKSKLELLYSFKLCRLSFASVIWQSTFTYSKCKIENHLNLISAAQQ